MLFRSSIGRDNTEEINRWDLLAKMIFSEWLVARLIAMRFAKLHYEGSEDCTWDDLMGMEMRLPEDGEVWKAALVYAYMVARLQYLNEVLEFLEVFTN